MQRVRRWSRVLHRDLSYFFTGVLVIYAVSGFMLNHKKDFNSDYSIHREQTTLPTPLPQTADGWSRERVAEAIAPYGGAAAYLKHYFPEKGTLKVFIRGGQHPHRRPRDGRGHLRVDTQTHGAERPEPTALQPHAVVDHLLGHLPGRAPRHRHNGPRHGARHEGHSGPRRPLPCGRHRRAAALHLPHIGAAVAKPRAGSSIAEFPPVSFPSSPRGRKRCLKSPKRVNWA